MKNTTGIFGKRNLYDKAFFDKIKGLDKLVYVPEVPEKSVIYMPEVFDKNEIVKKAKENINEKSVKSICNFS